MKNCISWGERFALIQQFQPTNEQILETFKVSEAELNFAYTCIGDGTFKVSKLQDVDKHNNIFEDETISFGHVKRFATKPIKVPQRRGRKGDKITNAFTAIPSTPVPLDDFALEHEVSVPVLRQSKRFDKTELPGSVKVKKILVEGSTSKQLMIWREKE